MSLTDKAKFLVISVSRAGLALLSATALGQLIDKTKAPNIVSGRGVTAS